jgi:hypothetical protein
MAAAQRWHWKIAAARRHLEVVLGSSLGLQRQRWAAAVEEEHATMASVSMLSKLRAYYYNVGVCVNKDGKRGSIQYKGHMLAAMATR